MRRAPLAWILLGPLALACAGIAMALVLTSDHEQQTAITLVVGELIGLSFVVAGLIGRAVRPGNGTGNLLALVGFTFFAGALGEANSSLIATIGTTVQVLFVAAFVHLLLAYPAGRLGTRLERRLVAAGYVLSVAFPLAYLLFADELSSGCDGCPSNAFLVYGSPALATTVETVASVAAAAILVVTIFLLAQRWRAASAAYRRSLRLVLLAGLAAIGLFLLQLSFEPLLPDAADAVLETATAVALVCVPFAFLYGLLRGKLAVSRLVTDLGPAAAPGGLRAALREALGDPTLELGYWLPDLPGFVDIEGRPFDPHESGAATFVDGETGRIGVLVHDPALLEEPAVLDGVVAAARLSLENERLHAELHARLTELERERDFTRLVVNTAPAYFCVVDASGRIVRFNTTLQRMTGIADDDSTRGRFFWDVFTAPEEEDDVRSSLALGAIAGRTEPHEATLAAADGSNRLVSWSEVVIPDAEGQLQFILVSGLDLTEQKRHEADLRRLVDEQAALRRIATLVAEGAGHDELVAAVTSSVGRLFDAQSANTMRWDGDSIRVIGGWNEPGGRTTEIGRVFAFGGDTVTSRVVSSGSPVRVDSRDELKSEIARSLWDELSLQTTIGAPIVVDGRVWGVITASRSRANHPFAPGAEQRLAYFAALVAQAIANAAAQRDVAGLAAEQAALSRVATLVAGGGSKGEVLDAVAREVTDLYGAGSASLMRWDGEHDVVTVLGSWSVPGEEPLLPGASYKTSGANAGATVEVLETGLPSAKVEQGQLREVGFDEPWRDLGVRAAIAAPLIVDAMLWGALTAMRFGDEPFAPGVEVRLKSFATLLAQAIQNAEAEEELRASRARIVQAADDARQKLERNLHDGAQQRLVAVSISLRLAMARLTIAPDEARELLGAASEELTHAVNELRELARGIHPAVLTDRGLGPALEALAGRTPLPVDVAHELEERLPAAVEVAAYYVVSESLANIAKYAEASAVAVRVSRRNGVAHVEVVDDGIGGADPSRGSGLRGLADRVEALDGRLGVDSRPAAGTRVWAEIPLM